MPRLKDETLNYFSNLCFSFPKSYLNQNMLFVFQGQIYKVQFRNKNKPMISNKDLVNIHPTQRAGSGQTMACLEESPTRDLFPKIITACLTVSYTSNSESHMTICRVDIFISLPCSVVDRAAKTSHSSVTV